MIEKASILITGAGGFIGSHLAERLVFEGRKVKAFIRYNSRNSWGWLESSPSRDQIEIITGDLRDYDSVKTAMKNVTIVFHLAALIGIPYSYISPLAYIKTNIEGTHNVLKAAQELGVQKIIHTSTSEVYGTAQFVPISEDHPINPQSPYAATKAAADYLALSYHRSFELSVAVIRPFNTYGPRQSARAVIPTIITQALSGQRRIKLGSVHPTRDLTYVKDTIEGFLKAAESDQAVGEVINIGSNFEISVEELARRISQLMNIEIEIASEMERVRSKASEVERLWADTTKAREILQWIPTYSLEAGLKETIAWLEEHLDLYKSGMYNV